MKAVISGALITLISAVTYAATPWHQVGSQGVLHFVVVDAGSQNNPDVFRSAIVATCGTARICQVHFWASDLDAPRRLPMTDRQVNSRLAIWQFNANTGYRSLTWRCDIQRGPDCF